MSFEAYLKARQFTLSSIRSRLTVLDQYLKWLTKENMEVEEVSYTDLLLFMKYYQRKGVTQKTIAHYMTVIRQYYDFLESEQRVTVNPATDIQVKGVKRKMLYPILEPQELHRLYHTYEGDTLSGRRNKVMLGLLIYQGLRTTELKRLEVKDVSLREGRIDVPGTAKSNGRILILEAQQVMDMYDYVLQVRPEMLKQSGKQTEKLLISPKGGTSISNFMNGMLTRLKKKMNGQVENARQLRASVIVKWLKQYNLREVQHLAGHRYISSAESYLHNEMEGLKEEIQQYHPLG